MTQARHIALILHDFATGGTERISIRLANRWAQEGRRVTLICGTERGAARALVGPGVTVLQCTPETVRRPWSRFIIGARMARIVRAVQPDLVFAPGNFHLVIFAFLTRLGFARRPVFVCKLSNPLRPIGKAPFWQPLADGIVRLAAARVDGLVAMSASLRTEAQSVLPGKAITEIDEPILEDDDAAPAPAEAGAERVILCAARLEAQKDLLTAIRAMALLPDSANARLVILGEGPLRAQLEREVARLGLTDRVDMPGYVSGIAPWLQRASLYLMSSAYEGYPAVLIEAMAAGVPIVTTNCSLALHDMPGSPAMMTIVDSREPAALAEAIAAALAKPRATQDSTPAALDRHRIGPSAQAYLALFDTLVSQTQSAADAATTEPATA